ncbi:MAG: ABC transporter permease [Solobacterium sp.]|nr:ABC transporter permease [Erysipelotrichaceae bacterium]MBQ9152736.1 ABC transporter permease [Solobacterium sp.]
MLKYIGKRLALGIVTLFALMTITFFLMHMIPGSPFAGELQGLSAAAKEQIIQAYQLDKPIIVQYGTYLKNFFSGQLGTSTARKGVPITMIIANGLPYTAKVGLSAFCTAMVIGIFLGAVSAFSKKKWIQGLAAFIATIGVSVPSFLFALFLMYSLGVNLKLLPIMGLKSWKHFIMPSLALALSPVAMISRLTRSSLSEELRQDYMILALSKGTSYRSAIWKHALKNAIIPVVTYAGPLLASLLTGSFVIESMFTIPGIGSEFVASVSGRDYPLIMALTVLYGSLVIIANILTDIVSAMIDPRIRLK